MSFRFRHKSTFILLMLLLFSFFIAGCVQTEDKPADIWQGVDLEKLKSPHEIDINNMAKEKILLEVKSVLKKAESLRDKSSGMMKEYWSLHFNFAEFLIKKIDIFSSNNSVMLKQSVSIEISKASPTECTYFKSFSGLADKLKILKEEAAKNNSSIKSFSLKYPEKAKEFNVNSLLLDETGFSILANKAKARAVIGEACLLYQKSKAFFQGIDFERIDCNNMADLYDKIKGAESLVSESEKLIDELESLGTDTGGLYDLHSSVVSLLNEIKQLYSDLNNC
ncbi:MAG: hypothetical protein QW400_00255 [Candidatus Diapherotrites archaeon]